jgi:hypothetical protein
LEALKNNFAYDVKQTSDGGYIILGDTCHYYMNGNGCSSCLIRTDGSGKLLWSRSFLNPPYLGYHEGNNLITNSDGGFSFVATCYKMNPLKSDLLFIRTDSIGYSGCNQYSTKIYEDSMNYVTGSGILTIGSGININSIPYMDQLILSRDSIYCSTLSLNENEQLFSFSLFPNPSSSSITLQTSNILKEASLTFYNSYGQTVKQLDNLSGQTIVFNRDNFPRGLYFIRLTQDSKAISVNKLIITDN